MNHWLTSMRDAMAGIAFPQPCALCGAPIDSLEDGITCHRCWQSMPRLVAAAQCPRCGLPRPTGQSPSPSCPDCRQAAFAVLRFAGPYVGALRANLLFLKHHPHICRRMRAMILETLEREVVLQRAERIVPVPLHPLRLKERGFNQADLIAKTIARDAKIPLDVRAMARVKHTERHRAGMDARARRKSLTAAFAVTHPETVRGRMVLLVDDIFTTGATLNACGRVLSEAGARAVYGFTVARALSEALLPTRHRATADAIRLELGTERS